MEAALLYEVLVKDGIDHPRLAGEWAWDGPVERDPRARKGPANKAGRVGRPSGPLVGDASRTRMSLCLGFASPFEFRTVGCCIISLMLAPAHIFLSMDS